MDEQTNSQLKRKDRFTGRITRLTLGGALVDLGLDRPGFLHLAQIKGDQTKRIEDALSVGQEIEVWVRNPNLDKELIELTTAEPLALEWREIKKGMTVAGKVQKIEKFGAFVEIGAERPGLVHVSELSHDYVRSPEEVVKVGDHVEAVVLDVDRKKRQIRLSVKALSQKPEAIMKEINREEGVEEDVPVPNAMEFALRAAMERTSGDDEPAPKSKRSKSRDRSMEEIFARTLENYKEN